MSISNIDETDEKIIRILQGDSRKAFVDIANEIGLSESAVSRYRAGMAPVAHPLRPTRGVAPGRGRGAHPTG